MPDNLHKEFITRKSSSQPQIYDNRYIVGNQPIIQRPIKEIQKKTQLQRPVVNERIDNKIPPHYPSVEPSAIMLSSSPEPIFFENFDYVAPLKQAYYSQKLPLRNSPEKAWTEILQRKKDKQREREAAALVKKETEIARATDQANERAAALAVKEAQVTRALNKPISNIYTPPIQHQYAHLPSKCIVRHTYYV